MLPTGSLGVAVPWPEVDDAELPEEEALDEDDELSVDGAVVAVEVCVVSEDVGAGFVGVVLGTPRSSGGWEDVGCPDDSVCVDDGVAGAVTLVLVLELEEASVDGVDDDDEALPPNPNTEPSTWFST